MNQFYDTLKEPMSQNEHDVFILIVIARAEPEAISNTLREIASDASHPRNDGNHNFLPPS
jgi:hypothetical protein